MSETTIGTIETLLSNAIEETTDPDVAFKLRQALQLVFIVEERHVEVRETLSDVELDEDVRENLDELGYLD